MGADPGRLRIGLLTAAPFGLPVDPICAAGARAAAGAFEGLGHTVTEVDLDIPDLFLESFLQVVNSGLADYEGIDWDRVEPHLTRAV